MNELYNKYYDLLKHIYNIMNLTNNIELKELSKKTIINTGNKLCNEDKKNEALYEKILVEFGLKEELSNEKNNADKIDDEISNDLKEYKNIDEYIFNKIYKNKNVSLGDEFQKIMIKLIESIKNNDKDNILVYKNKYDKFVNDNEDILDKNRMNEYYEKIYNENKINNVKSETLEEKNVEKPNEVNKDNEKKELTEGLKIKNVKKTYNSKLKNKALTLLALGGIGIVNPLMALGVGIGGYYLYKRGINNAKSLIEKQGLKIDNNDNLLDKDGKIVTKEDIGRLKYALV